MKALLKISFLASLALAFVACGDNMGDTDSRLTAVSGLTEPTDGKSVALEISAASTLYFEWNYTDVAASGSSVYQIAFDKEGGDFSNPIYMIAANNNGLNNSISITHKELNKIAGMAGILPADQGTIKWTVFASKGLERVKAAAENRLTITRLAGFEEVPIDVFVTGEASEGGTDLAKGHKMSAVAGGEFEVYTQLKGGKSYHFVDATSGDTRKFYTEGGVVKENGSSTVKEDGVYRITLDFNTGAATYTLVKSISFYFSPEGAHLFDLPYVGNGVFQAKNQTVTFKQEGWGRDERYKFRMFIREEGAAADEEVEWGTLNGTDSRPNAASPESYYYLKMYTGDGVTQWDNKWKLMGDFDDVPATYTIYLQADKPYTHTITK